MSTTTATHLVNATPFTVVYIEGRSEVVQLARLSIRQLYTFAHHLDGERSVEIATLCTGREPEWLDTLADESFAALVEKCIELNFPRAGVIAKKDPTLAAKLLPFAQKVQTVLVIGASLGEALKAWSPAPASPDSAAESGSESSISPPAASSPSSPNSSA